MDPVTQFAVTSEGAFVSRATVVAALPAAIFIATPEREPQPCDVIEAAAAATFAEGDEVLVWFPAASGERGVILGRVTSGHIDNPPPVLDDTPDTLVLEAKHSLTLRVGAGSITIREDGKILIKGKDLVSHAQRLNRIKGGAVQIN
jgi:hypothetical protein